MRSRLLRRSRRLRRRMSCVSESFWDERLPVMLCMCQCGISEREIGLWVEVMEK